MLGIFALTTTLNFRIASKLLGTYSKIFTYHGGRMKPREENTREKEDREILISAILSALFSLGLIGGVAAFFYYCI